MFILMLRDLRSEENSLIVIVLFFCLIFNYSTADCIECLHYAPQQGPLNTPIVIL